MMSQGGQIWWCVLAGLCVFAGPGVLGQVVHGPIVYWVDDPLTSARIMAVERSAEDLETPWRIGRSGFGYGDDDDFLILDMQGKHQRLYAVRPFYVSADQLRTWRKAGARGRFKVRYDDAFIVYLNGAEVLRVGVQSGSGPQALGVASHEAGAWETFSLRGFVEGLQPGKNVLAIEGHNTKINSSDFSLHPLLDVAIGGQVTQLLGEHTSFMLSLHDPKTGSWKTRDWWPVAATSEPSDRVLQWRVTGAAAWRKVPMVWRSLGDTPSKVWEADLRNLPPGRRIDYRMPGEDTIRHFRTAPEVLSADQGLRFVNGGDMYHEKWMLDDMNKRAGAESPLFAWLGGDLAYANGRDESRWYTWLDSWAQHAVTPAGDQIPMVVLIGNHETGSQMEGVRARATGLNQNAKFFFTLFDMPGGKSTYAVDFGSYLSLVNLDSDHGRPVSEQTAWLGDALARRVGVSHLLVGYHRPAYGTGVKANKANIQKEWSPLFEEYGVDAVAEHDHHTFKRSHPLRGGEPVAEGGVVYFGDGAWGVQTRVPGGKPELVKWAARRHLWAITLGADGTQVYEAKEADGTVIDHFER